MKMVDCDINNLQGFAGEEYAAEVYNATLCDANQSDYDILTADSQKLQVKTRILTSDVDGIGNLDKIDKIVLVLYDKALGDFSNVYEMTTEQFLNSKRSRGTKAYRIRRSTTNKPNYSMTVKEFIRNATKVI